VCGPAEEGLRGGETAVVATAETAPSCERTRTVTVPAPAAVRFTRSSTAPENSPGRRTTGIVCVATPSSPSRLAVTGPVVPTMLTS
jgi:hypothetical protein